MTSPAATAPVHKQRSRLALAARAARASLDRCLWTGAVAAGEVIKHYGARPIVDLKALVQL